jgi:tRNA pseudouridine(55) synthase
MLTEKAYDATIRLGAATTTDDAEGEVVSTHATDGVREADVRTELARFVGDIEQVPTAVSAIKVDGQRAYARVRAGEQVELKARPVTIHELVVHEVTPGAEHVDVRISVRCSSGTYIRAIARDLGAALGVGGHLSALRRTAVGAFDLAVVLAVVGRRVAPAPDWPRWRTPVIVIVLVTWAVIGGQRLIGKHADQARDTTMRALATDVQQYCRDRRLTRPILDFDPRAWQELAGLVLQFDKAGVPIAVSDAGLFLVGPPYARTGRDAAELYLMPTDAALPAALEGRTEWVATRGAFRVVRVR